MTVFILLLLIFDFLISVICSIFHQATSSIYKSDKPQYFAQELLSTFNTAIGEVCLQPSTGGTFIVEMFYKDSRSTVADGPIEVQKAVLWDRKVEGGFPGTS